MKIQQFPCMNGRPCTIAHKSMEMTHPQEITFTQFNICMLNNMLTFNCKM
jgi:hypothetical protein